MQLFSIGLFIQNQDGTNTLDEAGAAIPSYANENIVEFARAWTGFKGRDLRGNIEQKRISTANQVSVTDPTRTPNSPTLQLSNSSIFTISSISSVSSSSSVSSFSSLSPFSSPPSSLLAAEMWRMFVFTCSPGTGSSSTYDLATMTQVCLH